MKKIAYIGNVGWANTATALHVQNRARLIELLGIKVYAISFYPGENNMITNIPELEYHYLPDFNGTGKIHGLLWNIDQFICTFSYKKTIEKLQVLQPDAVVLYEINSVMFELAMIHYCKKNNIKIIIETTEWMGKEKDSDLPTRLIVQQKNFQKKYIDKMCKNIIAISEFLEEHYKKQKCHVVRIPPIFSNIDNNFPKGRHKDTRCGASVNIVYAGTLAQKDFLEPFLKAVMQINSKYIKLSFDIIGPDVKEIQNVLSTDELEEIGIFCHGRLPNELVLEYLKKADFSILLRQNMRYAKAGVSTKFVEAMCYGVPSICTKIGGTDIFVRDGENGFLINVNSEEEILELLEHILQMSSNEILEMKRKAHECARDNFLIEKYEKKMSAFLVKCK